MADNKINVGGRLHSIATGNVLAGADEILDDNKGKKQSEVNIDVDNALADRYTKDETYNKNELNSLITTPDVQYVTVSTYSQLPATGSADTIYRVSNYDGAVVDATKYAEYAWDGSNYILLSVKSAVDEVFDISVFNAESGIAKKYANLSTALADIPSNKRTGGMSVKFVQSSDNNYAQFRYIGTETTGNPNPFFDTSNWQDAGDCKSVDGSTGDFSIEDEDSNAIVIFKNGHIKTKEFDSSKDVSTIERGLMSAADKIKLNSIEEGAEVNDVETATNDEYDLTIEDEEGYMLVKMQGGYIKTKNFDSEQQTIKLATIEEGAEVNDVITEYNEKEDFSIEDENDNIILVIVNGHIKTKNFFSVDIKNSINAIDSRVSAIEDAESLQEWKEDWSRMPKTEDDNPLAKIRFDGGMCRIFRSWGFIGDSLNSGESYGRKVSRLSITEIANKAISTEGLIDDNTSICSQTISITGYQSSIKLIFSSNDGLDGKILVATVNGGVYTTKVVGTTDKEYIVSLTTGNIVLSFPNNNKPDVIFQNVTVDDIYEISWGQQLVRLIGAEGYNFSVGGEYCKRWCIGSDNNRRWDKAQTELKEVYTIALGVNDRGYWMNNQTTVVDYPCVTAYPNQSQYGSLVLTEQEVMNDVNLNDYTQNANSYAGWYAGIIQRLKSIRKDCQIFCITNPAPRQKDSEWNQVIRILVDKFNTYYNKETIWLVDLAQYNEITSIISSYCNLNGHQSAFGYLYSAYQISTYIDWIIRHNILSFKGSALIGSGNVANDYDTFLIK